MVEIFMKNLISVIEGILDTKSADGGVAIEASKYFPELVQGLEHQQMDYKNGSLTIDSNGIDYCFNSEGKFKIFREKVDKKFWGLVKTMDVNCNQFMFYEYERDWKGGVNAPKILKYHYGGKSNRISHGPFMTISNASNITIDCSANGEYNNPTIFLNKAEFSNTVFKGKYISIQFELSLPPLWGKGLKCPDAEWVSIYIDSYYSYYKQEWDEWLSDLDTAFKPFPKAKRLFIDKYGKSVVYKKEGNKWIER